MNLNESVGLLNQAAQEVSGRLAGVLKNLRGAVPESPSNGQKLSGNGGLCTDVERLAGTLNGCMTMLSELESMTSQTGTASVGGPISGYWN